MTGDPYIGTAREALPDGAVARSAGDGAPAGRQGAPAGDGAVRDDGGAPFRVLICDDHEVLRHGLRAVLLRAPDLRVVADAGSAADALALAVRLRPDVTVVGLGAWGPVVAELVRALCELGVRVVLLGEPGSGSDLVDALQAGACGYVHTTVSPQRLVDGVRAVARGEMVLDAAATGELLHRLDAPGQADGARMSFSGVLTARQMAVSRLVAEGLTNAEIAERLAVSRATVKGHITVALRRLGLRDRTQLAIHFHRAAGDLQA
ncbi:LuxR C-terminal-related transcriptional regulator [Modestobacter sp. VKM Ac-2978]|uniref:LuxR C-terminal-related transcriptional regulator n=1 Tax=Modestobacter sp. VKM Ac-2978 TaxID=3004132 RepID=UPI0022AA9D63|nr:response regulator transcription factor [Modestobacter sp. VKM Ac-2978]MCZ2849399.1 response regulator transcription factor [Modestobacter sp. VKM Ac-2978]